MAQSQINREHLNQLFTQIQNTILLSEFFFREIVSIISLNKMNYVIPLLFLVKAGLFIYLKINKVKI